MGENNTVLLEMKVTDCYHCPFLNSSDIGEDCRILRQGIRKGEWSNIDFQFDEGWRFEKCPLFHDGYLNRNCGIKVECKSERFMVDDCGTLIDKVTRDTYDYVEDVEVILNTLERENQLLKRKSKE